MPTVVYIHSYCLTSRTDTSIPLRTVHQLNRGTSNCSRSVYNWACSKLAMVHTMFKISPTTGSNCRESTTDHHLNLWKEPGDNCDYCSIQVIATGRGGETYKLHLYKILGSHRKHLRICIPTTDQISTWLDHKAVFTSCTVVVSPNPISEMRHWQCMKRPRWVTWRL